MITVTEQQEYDAALADYRAAFAEYKTKRARLQEAKKHLALAKHRRDCEEYQAHKAAMHAVFVAKGIDPYTVFHRDIEAALDALYRVSGP